MLLEYMALKIQTLIIWKYETPAPSTLQYLYDSPDEGCGMHDPIKASKGAIPKEQFDLHCLCLTKALSPLYR